MRRPVVEDSKVGWVGYPLRAHEGHSMESTRTDIPDRAQLLGADRGEGGSSAIARVTKFLERIDPGRHRRIKGLRLVAAYGVAVLLGAVPAISQRVSHGSVLSLLAGGFALWACVSEGRSTKTESCRDLVILNAAAVLGAVMM